MALKRKILLFENSCTDFFNSRYSFALFLQKNGLEVYALIPKSENYSKHILDGINIIEYEFNRNSSNLLQIFKTIMLLRKLSTIHNFELIHSFRFEPNLINVLANYFNKTKIIIHITGLGIVFSNNNIRYKILKIISKIIYLVSLIRANYVIIQNPDDQFEFYFNSLFIKKTVIIKGSGVDTSFFNIRNIRRNDLRKTFLVNDQTFVFICVTRLIWEKGIQELVKSFDSINNYNLQLWIVGDSDSENPRSVPQEFIDKYVNHKNIKFLGRCNNIRDLLGAADAFIYPSYYREGIPRGILEALSMSLPIITTDTPGCRLTVENCKNGYLIKARSVSEITNSVTMFYTSSLIPELSLHSRYLAETQFENNIIFRQIFKTYSL
jgi:glycosyltransferase involved in cell wall biosynthesis